MNISNLLKSNEKALKIVLCILLLISNFTIVVNADDTAVEETETTTENTEVNNEILSDEETSQEVVLESDEVVVEQESEEETENGVTGEVATANEQVPAQAEQQEVVEQDDVVTLVENTIVYSEDDYEITISGILPEGARVEAYEIKQENTEYNNLVDGATKSVLIDNDETDCDELAYSRFFDITILDSNNNVYEPNEPLKVEIDLKDVDVNSNDVTFSAVHFEDETNAQVVEVEVNEDNNVVTLEADSFSVYGIVYYYTVDFYYNGNEYHMNGGSQMLLSELFEKLGITKNVTDVTDVTFTDDSLVTITKENDDYRITSLKPFTTSEELSITFDDGEVIIINVEDAYVTGWGIGDGGVFAELHSQSDGTYKLIFRANSGHGGEGGTATLRKSITGPSSWNWSSYASQISEVEFRANITVADNYSTAYMFAGMTQLKKITFNTEKNGRLDTKGANSLKYMFQDCSNLKEVILPDFNNTEKAYEMQGMFDNCSKLEKIVLGSENSQFISRRSSVDGSSGGTQSQKMFDDCSSLKHLELINCDIDCGRTSWGNIVDSFRSAGYKGSLETLIIKDCKFPGAKDLYEAFYSCKKLTIAKITGNQVFPDAEYMSSMFEECFVTPTGEGTPTLDVSGFGKLDKIINMNWFVNGCTSLKTLIIDNLDNSVIGPYNVNHSQLDSNIGSYLYGRKLGLETCKALETLSAKTSKVWMVENNRGLPGLEYYNASDDENPVYYFTDKAMEFKSDDGPIADIDSNRDYIDLIIDRDGTNKHTTDPEKNPLPDAGTNINIKDGDLNTNGPGFLAPGVYTLLDHKRSDPEHAPMEDTYYRIAYVGEKPYTVEWPTEDIEDLVKVEDDDHNYVTINTAKMEWPTSGNKEIDCGSGIKITYKDVAIDCNGKLHDVIVTINKITFKDLDKIPNLSTEVGGVAYRDRDHDNNVAGKKILKVDQQYYRPILQATKNGITLLNYIRSGDDADPEIPGSGIQMISGGSGTDIDFTISIDKANKDTSFVFLAKDLDVAYSQDWKYNSNGDACYDHLPIENVTYGKGGEGFILGEGVKAETVQFASETGLYTAVVDGKTNVMTTGGDPKTPWSEFTVTCDAKGSNFTWTSGIGCTSFILENTKEQDLGEITIQPQIIKTLINDSIKAGDYEFRLERVSTDPDGVPEPSGGTSEVTALPQKKANDASGNVTFDALVYKTSGPNDKIYGSDTINYYPGTSPENNSSGNGKHNNITYTYKVTEIEPTDPDPEMIYDTSEHEIQIVISTPENDKEMKQGIKAEILVDRVKVKTYWHSVEYNSVATGTLKDKWYDESGNEIFDPNPNPNPIKLDGINFKNTKIEPLEVELPVEKILKGRTWKDTDEFAIALIIEPGSPDTPMPADTITGKDDLEYSQVIISSEDDPIKEEDKIIGYKDSFGAIEYKLSDVGTYKYIVRELTPAESGLVSIPGVTYDETSRYTLEVEIGLDKDDPNDIKLTKKITIKDRQGNISIDPRFTNTYNAKQTIYKMEAVKDYHDNNIDKPIQLSDNDFTFALKPIGDNAAIAPMPKDTEGTGAERIFYTGNEEDGDIEFENPDNTEDGLVFNYQALLEAGVDDEDLHSDEGVDFEYEMYEVIPELQEGETLVNNNDGTWSIINKNKGEEIIYDGIHHTRKITVKVRTNNNDTPDDTSDDFDELYIEGHKDDHIADFYYDKDGTRKDANSENIPGYNPKDRHFKVDAEDDLGAPIFLNYYNEFGSLKVNVKWDDDNNKAEKRTKTTFTLYKSVGGEEPVLVEVDIFGQEVKPITLDSIDDGASVQWDNLPLLEDGKEITYTVKETEYEEGYYIVYPEGTSIEKGPATSIEVRNIYDDSKPIEKTVTRKIHYLNNKGATVFEDVVESVTFVVNPKVKVDSDGNPILDENGKLQIEWYDEKDQLLGTDTGDGSKIDWGKSTVKKTLAKVASKDKYRYEFDTDEVEEIEVSPTDKDIEVNVIYTPDNYLVHFKPNGGSGEMDDQVMTWDELSRLSPNKFTRDGYVFKGWNSKADGTGIQFNNLQAVINLLNEDQSDITLYAQWEEASQPTPTPPTPYIPPKTGI